MITYKNSLGRITLTIFLSILLVLPAAPYVSAAINSCQADSIPDTVQPNSQTSFSFTITNNGPDPMVWIQILRPSVDFVITGASWAGSSSTSDDNVVLFGGTPVSPGDSVTLGVSAHAGDNQASSNDWGVFASDDPNGSGATGCTGNLGVAISGPRVPDPDTTPPVISDLRLSGLKPTSINLSWSTDEPTTSDVAYGETTNYGMAKHDGSLATSHSFILDGLSPDSSYHYQVSAADSSGNVTITGDGTFLTPAAGSTSGSAPVSTHIPVKAVPSEHVPPTISLSTSFTKSFKTAPTINGTAADNEALAGIEYSTDGGRDWLPADKAVGLGGKTASFSFTPLGFDDGDYSLLARAIDTSGNIGVSSPATLVIDRLPPLVGGSVINIGPQIMQPDKDGTINALVGVDQKITLSAVGGPTSIMLVATTTADKAGDKVYTQRFNLTASEDTGLWSGVLSFTKAGTYTLTAQGVDGAGNQTSRVIGNVYVSRPGRTLDKDTGLPLASTVTVYYQEPESHTWVVWDGAAFGQKNPQSTGVSKTFSLFLPPGTYYLRATAPGYHTLVGSVFHVSQPTPLVTDLNLSRLHGLHIGSHYLALPSMSIQHMNLISATPKNTIQNNLIGKQLPDFSLTDTTGATIHAADLLGRPTVISFDSTWAPTTAEQLATLSKLQANQELNVVPVALQESSGLVQAYTEIAGVKLRWLVDPDSTLSASYGVQSMPVHYFVDRKGIIQEVVVGVLNEKQMLDRLTEL
ncbi:MAG TPA: redoxin domain-containing protein [Patescibacteria group bacterium]|nr:redoxin domain-containing protein [Patescibacteria group bacterium]